MPDRSVKEEVRANLLGRLRAGEPLSGVVGHGRHVLPGLEWALLAGQERMISASSGGSNVSSNAPVRCGSVRGSWS